MFSTTSYFSLKISTHVCMRIRSRKFAHMGIMCTHIFYSYITTQTPGDLQDDTVVILLFLSFICLVFPTVGAWLLRWRAAPSNQMRLAAQMRKNGFPNSDIIKTHSAGVSNALVELIWSCSADWRKQWTLANVINRNHKSISHLVYQIMRQEKPSKVFPLNSEETHNGMNVHKDTQKRASKMGKQNGNRRGWVVFLTSLCKDFIHAWPRMDDAYWFLYAENGMRRRERRRRMKGDLLFYLLWKTKWQQYCNSVVMKLEHYRSFQAARKIIHNKLIISRQGEKQLQD